MSMHWGPVLRRSDDVGQTWTEHDQASVAFPADTGAALARIWQLTPGPAAEPDVIYAGIEPGALFRSDDGGGSWQPMTSIAGTAFGFPVVAHPSRPDTAYLLPLESDGFRCIACATSVGRPGCT